MWWLVIRLLLICVQTSVLSTCYCFQSSWLFSLAWWNSWLYLVWTVIYTKYYGEFGNSNSGIVLNLFKGCKIMNVKYWGWPPSPINTTTSSSSRSVGGPGHFDALIINVYCSWMNISSPNFVFSNVIQWCNAYTAFQITLYYPGNWLLYCVYFNPLLVINIFRHFSDVIHLFRNLVKIFVWVSGCLG